MGKEKPWTGFKQGVSNRVRCVLKGHEDNAAPHQHLACCGHSNVFFHSPPPPYWREISAGERVGIYMRGELRRETLKDFTLEDLSFRGVNGFFLFVHNSLHPSIFPELHSHRHALAVECSHHPTKTLKRNTSFPGGLGRPSTQS